MAVKRNIIAGWSAHLITVVIGFFLMPYVLGVLGDSRYGVWLFINAIAGYSGIVYAGFGATICRYVADTASRKEWDRLNQFVSSIQGVYFGTASIVMLATVVLVLIAPSLDRWDDVPVAEVQIAMLVVGGSIAMSMVASVYGGVLIGTQQLHYKRAIEVICGIVRGGLTVILLTQRWGLVTLSALFFVVTVVENVVSAWLAYRCVPTLSVSPRHIRRDVLNECFGFSAFNAVAVAAEHLIYFSDTIVIGWFLGPVAIVPYQIGLRIAQMIQMPIAQIGEAILPRAGQLVAQSERRQLGSLVCRAMGLAALLAGGFLIGGLYFGDLLIMTWIGRPYPHSHKVLCLLLATQVVAMPMVIVRKALLGSGEVRVPAFIDLLEAAANLSLSLILIQYWGIIGVAVGTLIPLLIIESSILLPFAARRLHISREALLQEAVYPIVPSLVALTVYCEIAHRLVPQHGWMALLGVTVGGGAVLIGTRLLIHLLSRPATIVTASTEQTLAT